MKIKRLLVAGLVIGLLVIAFFSSGNDQKNVAENDKINIKNQVASIDTTSSGSTETKENEKSVETTNLPDMQEKAEKAQAENKKEKLVKKQTADFEKKLKLDENAKASDEKSENKKEKVEDKKQKAEADQKVLKSADAPYSESITVEKASDTKNKKDKYFTDPVPEGKPKPVEWQDLKINKKNKLTCTLSVSCKTILDNMDKFNMDKLEVLPKDGVIYKTRKVTFYEGESVFDVLLREMKKYKIHMEFEMTPIYNSNYIEGIHNLYEFDCGELSGWMYRINGWFPNYGCSRYVLKDGDVVEWIYTCDLGRDIGGGKAVGGDK